MWTSGILTTLWTVEVLVAVLDLLRGVANTFQLIDSNRLPVFNIILWRIVDASIVFLSIIEIIRYKSGRLRPPFFVFSQGSRACFYTYNLADFIARLNKRYIHNQWNLNYVAIQVLMIIALYAGTAYGLIIWNRWRRLGYPQWMGREGAASLELQLLTPKSINQSDKLNVVSSKVFAVVNWIYSPSIEESGRFKAIAIIVNSAGPILKYLPGFIALVPLLTFTPRLASEAKRDFIEENPEFTDWNYQKPRVAEQAQYTDDVESGVGQHAPYAERDLSTGEAHDRAYAVSLHTIDQDVEPTALVRRQSTLRSEATMHERLLGPRYLCYLDETQPRGYRTVSTNEWSVMHRTEGTDDYIFVSYTRRQFYTQIYGDPSLPAERNATLQSAADRDTATLIEFAVRAAKTAGVGAFWIDYECVQPERGEHAQESMEDVYRICDIVRSSHSLAIVTGPPLSSDLQHDTAATAKADWLHDWGKRLWTVPEALLCPGEHRIAVYSVGTSDAEYVAKRNLASRVWDDAGTLRQLVDHYESSLPLTQLELISIALECLQRRQTEKRMSGDVAYALMGLLRQRPRVVKTDSDFQAFARLSLANDSDMLLERLICLKSPSADAAWYNMRDLWKARLWDIYPLCQVSNILDAKTIMLGGAQGAVINWSALHAIDYHAVTNRTNSWVTVRRATQMLFSFLSAWLITFGLFYYISSVLGQNLNYTAMLRLHTYFGSLCSTISLLAVWSPAFLRQLSARDIKDTQARFFGIEGYANLGEVERHLFGRSKHRIKWVSIRDPTHILGGNHEPLPSREAHIRQFTLIDTFTLTAVAFEAKRPPNVVIACGREHGFLRSVLCSYHEGSNTFVKETVLRMSTTVLDRMPKIDMFRFTLHEPEPEHKAVEDENSIDVE